MPGEGARFRGAPRAGSTGRGPARTDMLHHKSGLILTALLLGACPGEKNDTDAATEPATSGDTAPATESGTSTDGATEPTTTGSPTTPATTGESASTDPGETSTSTSDPPEATTCQKYCVMLAK